MSFLSYTDGICFLIKNLLAYLRVIWEKGFISILEHFNTFSKGCKIL